MSRPPGHEGDADYGRPLAGATLPGYTGTLHWWSPDTDQTPCPPGYTRAVCGYRSPLLPDHSRTNRAAIQCGRCRHLVGAP